MANRIFVEEYQDAWSIQSNNQFSDSLKKSIDKLKSELVNIGAFGGLDNFTGKLLDYFKILEKLIKHLGIDQPANEISTTNLKLEVDLNNPIKTHKRQNSGGHCSLRKFLDKTKFQIKIEAVNVSSRINYNSDSKFKKIGFLTKNLLEYPKNDIGGVLKRSYRRIFENFERDKESKLNESLQYSMPDSVNQSHQKNYDYSDSKCSRISKTPNIKNKAYRCQEVQKYFTGLYQLDLVIDDVVLDLSLESNILAFLTNVYYHGKDHYDSCQIQYIRNRGDFVKDYQILKNQWFYKMIIAYTKVYFEDVNILSLKNNKITSKNFSKKYFQLFGGCCGSDTPNLKIQKEVSPQNDNKNDIDKVSSANNDHLKLVETVFGKISTKLIKTNLSIKKQYFELLLKHYKSTIQKLGIQKLTSIIDLCRNVYFYINKK